MDRKKFLKTSAILAGTTILPSNSIFANNINNNGIEKITDDKGNFIQQSLPYNIDYLEPFMDSETLDLHHSFHHGGAVKGANKDIEMIKRSIKQNDFNMVDHWTKKLSFHLSSHILHSIFWTNLTKRSSTPSGALLKKIEKDFGSLDNFKRQFDEEAAKVFGSGWCWLVLKNGRLKIVSTPNQDNPLMDNMGEPLLGLDVWEHAYYLNYMADRKKYIKNFWKVVNWEKISEKYDDVK